MKTFALAFSSIVLGAAFSQSVAAQASHGTPNDRRMEIAQAGAGARGGAGGGGGSLRADQAGVSCGSGDSSYSDRRRTGTPPPLDPSRKVYTVDCTLPFDALAKGNLCCR